jgi:hypothetical protein
MEDTSEDRKAAIRRTIDEASVPSHRSPRRPPVPKWEYRFETYDRGQLSDDELKERVKKLGVDEWELAAVIKPRGVATKEMWVFKRPYYS